MWSQECEAASLQIKSGLANKPVLAMPDFSKGFILEVDASDCGFSGALLQMGPDGNEHPIAFFSQKLNKHQINYSTIEKEAFGLLVSLKNFQHYLDPVVKPTEVRTDHNPLVFLNKMANSNQKLTRWSMIIQEFDITIKHIKGKNNAVADALSRASF